MLSDINCVVSGDWNNESTWAQDAEGNLEMTSTCESNGYIIVVSKTPAPSYYNGDEFFLKVQMQFITSANGSGSGNYYTEPISGYISGSGMQVNTGGGGIALSTLFWTNYVYQSITTVESIGNAMYITQAERTWLDENQQRALEIYHFLVDESFPTAEEQATCQSHLQQLMTDPSYASYVESYYQYVMTPGTGSHHRPGNMTTKMWWESELWLGNANNFHQALSNNYFSNLALPVDYDDLNVDNLGSIENDDQGSFVGYNEATNAFEVKTWASITTPATVPPAQFQLNTELLRQLGRSHGWDQGVSTLEFNRRVGKAFEEAVLRSLFQTPRLNPQYEATSPIRREQTNLAVTKSNTRLCRSCHNYKSDRYLS